jgi:nicotinate-nucleotide adenylyltransferase
MTMRIGILGGTFNPIHNGHIVLAQHAKKTLHLDKVIFIPTYIPPHKTETHLADADRRYAMVELAIDEHDDFDVSDVEIRRKGTSYSVETLTLLRERFGSEVELFFIVGADALSELSSWRDLHTIFNVCHFVVANRPGFPLKKVPQEARILPIPEVDISSREIRKRIRGRASIAAMVPQKVAVYIEEQRLYR